jgi:hypothetical protein
MRVQWRGLDWLRAHRDEWADIPAGDDTRQWTNAQRVCLKRLLASLRTAGKLGRHYSRDHSIHRVLLAIRAIRDDPRSDADALAAPPMLIVVPRCVHCGDPKTAHRQVDGVWICTDSVFLEEGEDV